MFHPRLTITRDSSATHTAFALRIASINHTCGLDIALYSSLMSWVCFIFIPMLCEPTTRTADLASHITIWCTTLHMASAVQSRLDNHCNAIHMRSVPVEMIRIGRWLGRIGIWLIQLRSKWRWCYGVLLMAIGDCTHLRAKSHKSRYHESDGNKCIFLVK